MIGEAAPVPPPAGDAECARARPLLGTVVEIVARGPDADAVQAAVERAFQAVEEVHRLMSYHDPDSDVSRINREAATRMVTVEPHTWRVLEAAHEVSQASDGLFDITVATTLAALGFLPRHAGFPRASGRGDWRHVELRPGRRVRLARRLRIDLGGIAKGYAVDCAIDALKAAGVRAARVNAGGDLRVFGAQPQTIRVRRPDAPTETLSIVALAEGAVATSAGYFSARRHDGHWITPLIQPHTRSCCPRGRSVTVLAPDCMTADALTKVVYADPQRAIDILPRFAARAFMLQHDADTGVCRVYVSHESPQPGWRVGWQPGAAP